MNELTEAEFLSQVGDHGYREVVQLAEWLLTTDTDAAQDLELKCRYATSVVTKSEAEIFGLSDPRLAIRLYLENGSGTSMLNLRRIDRMRAANPRWGRRLRWLKTYSREEIKALPTPKEKPRELLKTASRIGDCLLKAPTRITSSGASWVILQADLGREYGESSEEGAFVGTPYLRHIPLAGGGLCAQAVCYMATALLHEHATGLHGLLEITALAQRDIMQQAENDGFNVYEMQISGLNYGGLTSYFRAVGLRAIKQVPKTMGYAQPSADWTNRNDAFTAAAKAYLRSGMPVVVTVDVGRMAAPADPMMQLRGGLTKSVGKPIYESNGWEHPEFERIRRGHFQMRRDHAVLLVGCKDEPGSEVFLVNDPASLPFLQARTGQLAEAGYYASRWSVRDQKRHTNFEELRSLHCLPVTPAAVKVPLLWWLPESQVDEEDAERTAVEHWQDGLFGIVPVLFSGAIQIGRMRLPFISPHQRYRDFRLLRMGDLVRHCAEFLQGEENLPDIASIREKLIERFEWKQSHWAWVQFVRKPLSIWIYDAEATLPSRESDRTTDSGRGFLRVGVWTEGQEWYEVVAPRTRKPTASSNGQYEEDFPRLRMPSEPMPLRVTSACSAKGVQDFLRQADPGLKSMDLFAFMRPDIPELAGKRVGLSAAEWMAANCNPREVEQVAQKLRQWAGEEQVLIEGVTSYLPEIAAFQERDAGTALNALRFLVLLTENLHRDLDGGSPPTLTLAAGNRVQGIWPGRLAKEEQGQVYMANVISRETLGRIVLTRLKDLVKGLDEASQVRFALELEAGELHLLNDWHSLAWFALELESSRWKEDLGNRVGFTLNIARWAFLAGIRTSQLNSEAGIGTRIRKRILRAEISDLGKVQLGGQAPGVLHDEEAFRPWMDLVRDLAREHRPDGMEFSKGLSLVMESCLRGESISEALEQLREWQQALDAGEEVVLRPS